MVLLLFATVAPTSTALVLTGSTAHRPAGSVSGRERGHRSRRNRALVHLKVEADQYRAGSASQLKVGAGHGVLANDSDSPGQMLTVAGLNGGGGASPFRGTSADGATITLRANGSFIYDPSTSSTLQALKRAATVTDTFGYQVADRQGATGDATVTITVWGANKPPALASSESSSLAYIAGAPPAPILTDLALNDPDDQDLSGATVRVDTGFVAGEDVLRFVPQGRIAGRYDPQTGELMLSGRAPLADYQAVLRSVSYGTVTGNGGGTRTLSFQVDDGHIYNHLSNVVSRTVVVSTNTVPTAHDDSASTDKNRAIDIPVLANDADSDGDALSVASVDTSGTQGSVTINPDGTIHYDPGGRFASLQEGQSATDTFTYRATDGFQDSDSAMVRVTVTGANDPPVLSNVEPSAATYVADGSAVPVSSSLTVGDDDDAELAGATVWFSSGFVAGKDSLSFVSQNGISGSYDSGAGVLTLTGPASLADYQAALRSVSYSDSDTVNPAAGIRTISFQVDDGHDANDISNTVTRDIQVSPVPPPVAVDDSATTGADTAVSIPVLANDADPDGDVVSSEGGPQVLPYAIPQSQAVTNGKLIQIVVNSGESRNPSQSLLCDGSGASNADSASEMYDLQVNGCPLTQVNPDGSTCPAAPLSPPSCLNPFTTVDESSGFDAGHIYRFENGSTWPGSVSCTQPVPIPPNNYAELAPGEATVPGDPRLITVYVVPSGALSSTPRPVAILGYAEFYVAGWDHDPCITPAGTDPRNPGPYGDAGTVWGYVVGLSRSMKVASVDTTGTKGSVTINPDGTIQYDPAGQFAGLQGGQTATDTFSYRATDGYGDSNSATVTVTIDG